MDLHKSKMTDLNNEYKKMLSYSHEGFSIDSGKYYRYTDFAITLPIPRYIFNFRHFIVIEEPPSIIKRYIYGKKHTGRYKTMWNFPERKNSWMSIFGWRSIPIGHNTFTKYRVESKDIDIPLPKNY